MMYTYIQMLYKMFNTEVLYHAYHQYFSSITNLQCFPCAVIHILNAEVHYSVHEAKTIMVSNWYNLKIRFMLVLDAAGNI
jgi:hypothetical protein